MKKFTLPECWSSRLYGIYCREKNPIIHLVMLCFTAFLLLASNQDLNAQALTFNPNPIDMGNIEVGQMFEAFVDISDSDPVAEPNANYISNVFITNDTAGIFVSGNYYYDDNVGFGNLGVGINPINEGTYTATLNVEVDETDGTQIYQIPITATVIPASYPELTASNLDFNTIHVNTNTTQDLILSNSGNEDLVIDNFNLDNSSDTTFTYTQPSTPLTITPGNTYTIPITFSPLPLDGGSSGSVFNRSTTLTITSNNYFEYETAINVTGNVFPSNPVETDTDFGNVEIGQTVSGSNSITNNGEGELFIDNVYFDTYHIGADATADFSLINPPTFPVILAQGQSLTVDIEFTPNDLSFRRVYMRYAARNHTSSVISPTIEGVGVQSEISFPTDINAGNVRKGESETYTLEIQNPGTLATQISALEISGTNADVFSITGSSPQTIPAGGSVDYSVEFSSDTAGGKTAQINFTSNVDSSPHSINLLANITNSKLRVSPAELEFPEVLVGSSTTPLTVTLSNEFGTDAVEIQNIVLPSSDFTVSGITTPLTIAAGGESSFQVQCNPQQTGNVYAPLIVESNDDKASIGINLMGIGVTPEIQLSRTQMFFLNTALDSNGRTEILSIQNNGTGDLILNDANIVNSPGSFGPIQFELSSPLTLPVTIPSSESYIIPVKFNPSNIGGYTGRLNLATNDGDIGIFLSGTAIAPSAHVDKNEEFPENIRIGESITRAFTITNNGVGTLEISDFELVEVGIDADDEPDFTLDITLPYNIAQGQTRTLQIVANPISTGYKNVQLELTTNTVSGAITGDPLLWSYNVLDLAYFEGENVKQMTDAGIGETSYTPYTITNTGEATMVVYGEHAALYQAGGTFTIPNQSELPTEWNSYNNFPFTLDPGDSNDIIIAYSPSTTSAYGEIALKTGPILNNANEGGFEYSAIIKASGGALLPALTTIEAQPITFPLTSIGRSNSKIVTIKNTGTTDLIINNTYGDGTYMFKDQGSLTNITLGVGNTMDFEILFNPSTLGTVEGYFGFDTNVQSQFVIVNATGEAKEPDEIVVNGLTFEADTKIDLGDGKYILSGNVHAGKMEFGGDVTINLGSNNVSCQCKVYTTNITPVGEYGGEEVDLMEGDITFKVEQSEDGTPYINAAIDSGLTGVNTFLNLVDIPIEFSKFELITGDDPGIEVGGSLDLPADIFGPDVNVTIDRLRIVESGVNLEGSSSISGNPAVKVLNTFELQEAGVNFNTFENSFGGNAAIRLSLLGKTTSIAGGVQIINGGLDSVSLEVEISPGIPLANTGWELSGGNGFINGIQVPPLSIGLGVDLKPIAPIDILKLDNMQLAYTFGTSLEASGTILVLNQTVGGGSILVNNLGLTAEAYVNLYGVFRGDVSLLVENRTSGLFAEAMADMSLTIPEIPAADCAICEAVNGYLPYTIAELKAKINNDRFKASTTIADVLTLDIGVEFGGDVKVGGKFGIIPFGDSGRSAENNFSEFYIENDENAKAINELEGGSLVVASRDSNSQIPFNLSQNYSNVIVRIEGDNAYPDATLTLPDGTVITPTSAETNDALYTESNENFRVFYTLKDTQIGEYEINVEGAGPYEIDLFGAGFAPEIEITSVNYDNSTKDVTITWNDQDLDSDAVIALYYDIDGKGANGKQIVGGISENDTTNQYTFNASNLISGTYFVYAKIEDESNPAEYAYATTTFTVVNESPVVTPTLIGALEDNVFKLAWNPVNDADHYVMYIDEELVTRYSSSQGVGDVTAFDFKDIAPGRTYKFGVTAMREELDGSYTESNLSNIIEFEFISPDVNNIPKLETESLAPVTDPCSPYTFTVNYSDPDTGDILELTMPTHPEGMTLAGNTINWTPTADQIGKHQVILNVADDKGGVDEKSFVITVFNANSAPTPDLSVLPVAEAACSVTLNAPSATDDCSGTITATTTDATAYTQPGDYMVTWVYDDGNGNQATQQQRVIVTDTELPTIACQHITVALDETTGSVTILPEDLDNGTTDNCAEVEDLTFSLSEDTFTATGVYDVTLTVEDENNNLDSCVAQVTVEPSLSIDEATKLDGIKLYPNPNRDGRLNLEIPDDINLEKIEIYDAIGRKVMDINHIENYINIDNLSSGSYLIKFSSAIGNTTKRISKL
ncbi:choice-of-anchor D domain-containing protein [Winogradskyella sp. SM1960]|uniref:choice-of-anchor D domain-containing protein n=1 Tax=Winogradskyella sp. SM1960 TaxID=2865955 RepID=UPI001CD5C64D|nr:choice-of-anchor D domain-containing protein [Winogradskyella sp. SM1960]